MILQICNDYQEGRIYQYLFDELEKQGIGQDIFYFTSKKKTQPPHRANLLTSQAYRPWERVFYFHKQRKVYKDLRARLRPQAYGLSHAHSLMTNGYMAYHLKKEWELPYVITIRSSDTEVFFRYKPYLLPYAKRILAGAAALTFLSPASQARCLDFFPREAEAWLDKSHIIPNGIDQRYFRSSPPKKLPGPVKRLVFMATRIEDPNKNFSQVLAMVQALLNGGEAVELVAIGQVEPRTKRAYLGLPVEFTGPLDQQGILEELGRGDLFIMPSYRESFGLVYVEAMSQGLPVIYTRGQGFDGQFPDGQVGYGVGADQLEEMIEAYQAIFSDYQAMSRRAWKESRKYHWTRVAASYRETYREVADEDFNGISGGT